MVLYVIGYFSEIWCV